MGVEQGEPPCPADPWEAAAPTEAHRWSGAAAVPEPERRRRSRFDDAAPAEGETGRPDPTLHFPPGEIERWQSAPTGAPPEAGRPVSWQPPPGWQPPRGWVVVPVRRRRRWPWVLLIVALLIVACCCGCVGAIRPRAGHSAGSTVQATKPSTLITDVM